MLRRKNARGKGPPTEAVLEHAGAGPNRRPSPRTRHRATTKTPRPASRVSSPKSPKFTDSLLEGTRFELSSRCRSSGLPQGGWGGPSCRIPAEDSWRTSAAAPSPNDIRSALAKTQHKMAPSVHLLRIPGTKGSNLSSSSGESANFRFLAGIIRLRRRASIALSLVIGKASRAALLAASLRFESAFLQR
jgi:hypothetical protein